MATGGYPTRYSVPCVFAVSDLHGRIPVIQPSTVRDSTASFFHHLSNGTRPGRSARLNPELSHFVDQCRARQSKSVGRSVLPPDHPVRLLERFENVFPISVGKRA